MREATLRRKESLCTLSSLAAFRQDQSRVTLNPLPSSSHTLPVGLLHYTIYRCAQTSVYVTFVSEVPLPTELG
jgi:hypothetical protein